MHTRQYSFDIIIINQIWFECTDHVSEIETSKGRWRLDDAVDVLEAMGAYGHEIWDLIWIEEG